MAEEDRRGYVYRFIKERDAWGFIALEGTDMETDLVKIVPFERWSTNSTGGAAVSYELCSVLYSKNKVRSMIERYGTSSIMMMSGTDVFQVIKRNSCDNTREVACVIWVPDNVPDSLDITCYSPRCNKLIDGGAISFIDLKRLIQQGLAITVEDTTVYTQQTHVVV